MPRSGTIAQNLSGCDGQGGGAALGVERGFHQLARFVFATAAAGGAAGARLYVLERARAVRHRTADCVIRDGFADADVHGGILEGRHLNANANDCQVP